MNPNTPTGAIVVVLSCAFVCAILVSATTVTLRPIQEQNQLIERSRNIVMLSGLVPVDQPLSGDEVLAALANLDPRVVDLESGTFIPGETEFDARAVSGNPEFTVSIPTELDSAGLRRRTQLEQVYLVWKGDQLHRVIVPINGQGMWSRLWGFIALNSDLNTIGAVSFYEQAETAGLGDQIMRSEWQAQWSGRQLFDQRGNLRFRVAPGPASDERHEVDGLSGATVTADAVTGLVAYWFGSHGYAPFLAELQSNPPTPGGEQ